MTSNAPAHAGLLHHLLPISVMLGAAASILYWFSMVVKIDVPARSSSSATVSVFSDGSADAYEVRKIQSPVLFSLPTDAGFSGPTRISAIRISQPPVPEPTGIFLTALPGFSRPFYGLTEKSLEEMIQGYPSGERPGYLFKSINPPLLGAAGPGYRFFWQDNPDEPVVGLQAPALSGESNRAPWQAIYFICFNEAGFVDQLLVEAPPPAASLNEAWVRTLRAWRADNPAGPRCRRLVVSNPALAADRGG